jgi:hypothetical protein
MAEYGHIKVSRKMYLPPEQGGDPFWNERRVFSRYEAWEYMIQAAAYADHTWAVEGGAVVRIRRGETRPLSVRTLMKKWGWKSKKRVTAFVQKLMDLERICVAQRTIQGDTYLLVNYEAYQGGGDSDGDTDGDSGGDSGGYSGGDSTREEGKEGEVKKVPRKRRASARESWDTWRPKDGHAELATAQGLDLAVQESMFRDHFIGNGKPLRNRDAAFRNWLRRAKSFDTNGRTHGKARADSRRTDGQTGRDPEGAGTRPSKYEGLVKRSPVAAGGDG